ncbi:MAG TPA: oligoendopeptidase F [Clostridia bacterium]
MEVLTRDKIDEKYKWKLEDIYPNDELWEKDFKELQNELPKFSQYAGKLKDAETILEVLKLSDEFSLKLEKLFVYAFCRKDENTTSDKYVSMYNKISMFASEASAQTSFINPELSQLPKEKLEELANSPEFKDYDYMLKVLIKQKPHILNKEEEKLLSMVGDFAGDFQDIFVMIDNADFIPPEIEVDGKPVKVTHGNYGLLMQNKDKEVRKKAYKAYYAEYKKRINALAANYYANVKKNIFFAKARKYNSYLEKAVSSEDVPIEVYNALIKAVNDNIDALHRYVRLRKRVLNYSEYNMYDMYTPLVEDADLKLEYEDAVELVKKGLAPLGEEYQALLDKAFSERWIDVFETPNKKSGAYSIDAVSVHPFILLNYHKTTHDVFTIAHELGHAMHSYYSSKYQPASKARYEIFVAEVASTVNEMLLLEYLLKTAKDDNIKKYLLSYRLDAIRTTLFRQTQFAEFEKRAHDLVQEGQPLTPSLLNSEYAKINKRYYGDAVTYDDEISIEWARIPHFYRSFYVYKYATGITSAIDISQRIINGEKGILNKYMNFLKAGGSKSPYEILKDLGVDLASPEPYNKAMTVFKNTVEELEKLF